MNFFSKIFFYIKKPKIIILFEDDGSIFKLLVKILGNDLKIYEVFYDSINPFIVIKSDIIVFRLNYSSFYKLKRMKFFIQKSSQPIIAFSNIPEIKNNSFDFLKFLPSYGKVIADVNSAKKIKKEEVGNDLAIIPVGFDDKADFRVTDVNIEEGTNFKIVYSGDVIPFWIKNQLNEDEIEKMLIAISICMVSGKNLIKISQTLQEII